MFCGINYGGIIIFQYVTLISSRQFNNLEKISYEKTEDLKMSMVHKSFMIQYFDNWLTS